jgi:GTP pyrophosphokinase
MGKHHQVPDNPEEWLKEIARGRGERDALILQSAINLYDSKVMKELLDKGLGIVDILQSLNLDTETLAIALSYPALQAQEIHIDTITDYLGENSKKILEDVLQMQSLSKLQHLEKRGGHQIENLRKMLLSMVTDVRAVLIVLAERLWQLRHAKKLSQDEQKKLAQETFAVYTPLANRLGVWQLKWESEDLCLRYLQPETYMQIAKGIAARRDERETYITEVIATVTKLLHDASLKEVEVSGRVKHIYSIYRKMQRKNATLEEIYDMSALRVLVARVEDCYTALSILQNEWEQIPKEFDDYIAQPKPNGYRSIHTVLIGPKNYVIEVQIRTHQMHQESELGVAAHWRYKEGVRERSGDEAKIVLLRQIIAWQKEVTHTDGPKDQQLIHDLFADRIYVFTKAGDIIDLPTGATPLDFAYHIHSEVGHRCRGAKVDGAIVPLTYSLQTGERVEILTTKQAHPSRDWLNPHLNYLKTARARSKVQHYFRAQDSLQTTVDGREILEKELKRTGLSDKIDKVDLASVATKLNFKTVDAMLGAIASGDLRLSQIIHLIQPQPTITQAPTIETTPTAQKSTSNIQVLGINNLLTHMARCCKPLPGDDVIGYITRNHGVSIHRSHCQNVSHLGADEQKRLIEVYWAEKQQGPYPADLLVLTINRSGILRDITTILAAEKVNVLGLHAQAAKDEMHGEIYLTIEITSRQQLQHALNLIKQIPSILEVRRR